VRIEIHQLQDWIQLSTEGYLERGAHDVHRAIIVLRISHSYLAYLCTNGLFYGLTFTAEGGSRVQELSQSTRVLIENPKCKFS
jgi:hypothetical protein